MNVAYGTLLGKHLIAPFMNIAICSQKRFDYWRTAKIFIQKSGQMEWES